MILMTVWQSSFTRLRRCRRPRSRRPLPRQGISGSQAAHARRHQRRGRFRTPSTLWRSRRMTRPWCSSGSPLVATLARRWRTTRKIDLKLGAPNLPGFVMTITGEVKSKDDANGLVDIEVTGENNVWGMHMQGTVQVQLPKGA